MEDLIDLMQSPRRGSVISSKVDEQVKYTEGQKDFLEVNHVRIIPSRMIFKDAYDGKRFIQSFTIINAGKYPALVRVFSPTSKAFKMKPLPKGRYLSSGMSVTRRILYTYTSAMALPQACLSIYINEELVLYDIEVYISNANITLMPKILSFGEIDVGTASEQMALHLTNSGSKGTHFVVDLGRNDLELIVHPMKGLIKPSETKEIKVEVLGTAAGTFLKEFWIKTDPPQRVWIRGTFILAQLVIEHPLTIFDLTVIDFPKTYYGAKSKRTVVIENRSSRATMFCTMAESLNGVVFLDEARQHDDNLKCFYIIPKEGRLMAKHKYILGISFVPKKIKNFIQNYCMVFIRILKINYRDGVIDEKDIEVKTFSSTVELDQYSIASLHNIHAVETVELDTSETYLRVCLYGEIEEANVELTPNAFDIAHLVEGETCIRTFNIRNESKNLPITLKYDKIACIEIEPKEVALKPNGSVDVSLQIKPTKIGLVDHKIILKLFYRNTDDIVYEVGSTFISLRYVTFPNPSNHKPRVMPKFNTGITPAITNEVGFLVDDIRFNSTIKKPMQAIVDTNFKSFDKNNCNIIAFPNDRAASLRPWRGQIKCQTIFANIPRFRAMKTEEEYELTNIQLDRMKKNKIYYSDYLKSMRPCKRSDLSTKDSNIDYDITRKDKTMRRKSLEGSCLKLDLQDHPTTLYIPMPPEKLLNIEITPRYIQLGKIAPYTTCSDCFAIKNRNDFPIHISIRALSNSVVIKGKKRITIDAYKSNNIFFDCYSYGLGKYYVPVYLIVNDCHIFDATVFAEVVPTTIRCTHKQMTICPRGHVSLFEIYNPVNCGITFAWEVQDRNYTIVPEKGVVPSRKNVYCLITFTPQIDAVFSTEIYLLSQSGAKEIIRVINENEKVEVDFCTRVLNFDDIPLNTMVTRKLVLRNFSEETVTVIFSNSNPLEELKVFPIEGTLYSHSDMVFKVSALFKTVVKFNCVLTCVIQDEYYYDVKVTGNVCYPQITLEPKSIQIHKIVTGALQRRSFRVVNKGVTKNFISFSFENYPEFSVTDIDKNTITKEILLEPAEAKDLFLEFHPTEPTAYSLYLPYILNSMIGPPVMNNARSLNSLNYFKKLDDSNYTTVECPSTIPVLTVRCAAGAPWFKFSSLHLDFIYRNEISQNFFEIRNISQVEHVLLLPLPDMKKPFSVSLEHCTGECDTGKNYHRVHLMPEQRVTWLINYSPKEYGQCELYLPIMVEAYTKKGPFNFLRLSGSYSRPGISCRPTEIFLQTIPVKESTSQRITLKLSNHKENCLMTSKAGNSGLSLILEEKMAAGCESERNGCIVFSSTKECAVSAKIEITCSCGAACELSVKCAVDNCTLISYGFYFRENAEEDNSSFPYFPTEGNNAKYFRTMNAVVDTIERWLYSQGFFTSNFLKIPETISMYPFEFYKSETKEKKGREKKKCFRLPLIQLLVNLLDDSILKYFTDGKSSPSRENLAGAIYDYGIYKNVMEFLNVHGIFVQQLKPELLLTYERYVVFINNLIDNVNVKKNNEEKLSEEDFFLLSKQCWVDLLLNVYRVFVFDRTIGSQISKPIATLYDEEFSEYFDNNIHYFQRCNENEARLILWLEFHFQRQKDVLWPADNIEPRKVRTLNKESWDCLPLVTLMAAYCPYISNKLKEAYTTVTTRETLLHNACLLYELWNNLNLSYLVKPKKIFEPMSIELTMLLTYLYDVLPSFYPSETIPINSALGESTTNQMELKNCSEVPIAYTPSLFINDSEEFEIDSKVIMIPPKKVKKLKISYTAKAFVESRAVLVLSGETIGYRFAKSKAVNLIGIPDIFHSTQEFSLKIDMYKPQTHQLDISSPYPMTYDADTYLYLRRGDEIPSNIDEFISVSSMAKDKVPREICMDSACRFNAEGKYTMILRMCFVTCGVYNYFIYFLNKHIGVFCIKLTIICKLADKSVDDLVVVIPSNFTPTDPCKCKNGVLNNLCPKVIYAEIPCRNRFLLEGLRKTVQGYADTNECQFWDEHLVFPKGFHIFGRYLKNTFNDKLVTFSNVLNANVSFNTLVTGKKYSIQKSILIPDVTSALGHRTSIHWDSEDFPVEEVLILKSEHGQETRRYKLIFRIK